MEENRNGDYTTNNIEQTPIVQVTTNGTEKSLKKRAVAVTALQIITAVIYTFLTTYFMIMLIDVINTPPPQDGSFDGRGLALAAFLIITIAIGGIGYIINLIVSIAGIVVSANAKKKDIVGMGSIIYFVIFTVLPIITFICFLLLPQILIN